MKENKKAKKTVIILSVLLAFFILLSAFLTVLLFNPTGKAKEIAYRTDIIKIRTALKEKTDSWFNEGKPVKETISEMDKEIDLVPEGEEKESLKLYKISLLFNHYYYAEALQTFREIENDNFTEDQYCELYQYGKKLAALSPSSAENNQYAEKYTNSCVRSNNQDSTEQNNE